MDARRIGEWKRRRPWDGYAGHDESKTRVSGIIDANYSAGLAAAAAAAARSAAMRFSTMRTDQTEPS